MDVVIYWDAGARSAVAFYLSRPLVRFPDPDPNPRRPMR